MMNMSNDTQSLIAILISLVIGLIIGTRGLHDTRNLDLICMLVAGLAFGAILQWFTSRIDGTKE